MTRRKLVVLVAVGAGLAGAGAYGFVDLVRDLGDARAQISTLEDELAEAEQAKISALDDSRDRVRELRTTLESRLGHARRRNERLFERLDDTLCFRGLHRTKGFFTRALRGDIDGDGLSDTVRAIGRPSLSGDCRYFIVVETASARLRARVYHEHYGLENSLEPWFLVDFNGIHGYEIVVQTDEGAYAEIAQIFTVFNGELTRMRGFGARDLWISGASTGNGSAFGCLDADGGSVFNDVWTYAGDGRRHKMTRRFYRVHGDRATLYFEDESVVILEKALQRLPEFESLSDEGFGACPAIYLRR